MTKAQERKVERLRSNLAMAMLHYLEENSMLEHGVDIMHVGGSLFISIDGLGPVRVAVVLDQRVEA